MSLKKFGKISGIAFFIFGFLLVSAPPSTVVADDEIKALERKLELLKQKASRKTEYQKMLGMLEAKLQEIQDQIKMLNEEYKDVAKSAPAPAEPAPAEKEKASASGFAEMIKTMEKAAISLRLPENMNVQPFRIKKRDTHWGLEHQRNWREGKIIDKGENVVWLKQFPPNWPINGSWQFSRTGDKCRLDQLESDVRPGKREMTWSCK